MMNRRKLLFSAFGLAIGASLASGHSLAMLAEPIDITVYKSPTCGCCKKWVEHLRDNHFAVTVHETEELTPIKQKYAVPEMLQACHTALIGGYVIEGHVPARDIRKLLNESPSAIGLAVPGMPNGSPGMEGDQPTEHFEVLLFNDKGQTQVFNRY